MNDGDVSLQEIFVQIRFVYNLFTWHRHEAKLSFESLLNYRKLLSTLLSPSPSNIDHKARPYAIRKRTPFVPLINRHILHLLRLQETIDQAAISTIIH